MDNQRRLDLLARAARAPAPGHALEPQESSILALAAASYGARPTDDATVPTGFDPMAAALFESIVEAAYLVATADGVFDEGERRVFERVVIAACGGTVAPQHVAALVSDLGDQLAEDGLDRRIAAVAATVTKREHALEVLRIAALLAQATDDVSPVERDALGRIAAACGLEPGAVDEAMTEVREALTATE